MTNQVTFKDVEEFIQSINGNPADYCCDGVANDLNNAGLSLADVVEDQRVWDIFAMHDSSAQGAIQ